MSELQERLWSELVRDHAAALSPPRGWRHLRGPLPIVETRTTTLPMSPRWRSVRLAALAAALAGAIATMLIAVGTSTSPPLAYAVTQTADGTLQVTIDELTGIDGANAELAKLGVSVRVVPVRTGCPAVNVAPPAPSSAGTLAHIEGQGLVIQPRLIPQGDTLVLAARRLGSGVSLSYQLFPGSAPPCIPPGDSNAG